MVGSTDFSFERGAVRAEDAQETPTQSHISPSVLVQRQSRMEIRAKATSVAAEWFGSTLVCTSLVRHDGSLEKNLQLKNVPIGTVLNLRTTTSQKCAAVPRRARIQGSWTLSGTRL